MAHETDLLDLDPYPCAAEWLAGVDEAGRGPLAGPVFAAAVILDPAHGIEGLADSKKLSPGRRTQLAGEIRFKALAWAVASASALEIDRINILQATLLAMLRAVHALSRVPEHVLVDGNRLPRGLPCPAACLIGGDARVPAISAASILAKTARDAYCQVLHEQYPEYGFDAHKGYGTARHLASLLRHGPCPEHRRSFRPVREAMGAPSLARSMPEPEPDSGPERDSTPGPEPGA
ncbi:ribonuclease HII [Castellaniella sp.]|uniref:ribonuclease HII n=1 Tax=Castellaniella sp. TaxID=1955812 RepID=UPI00355D43B9